MVELELGGQDLDPERHYIEVEMLDRLRSVVAECINTLDAKSAHAVVLVYFEEMTYEGAAHTLGVTNGCLRVRLHRALRRLQPCLSAKLREQPALSRWVLERGGVLP